MPVPKPIKVSDVFGILYFEAVVKITVPLPNAELLFETRKDKYSPGQFPTLPICSSPFKLPRTIPKSAAVRLFLRSNLIVDKEHGFIISLDT